jgi:hypothetical protein
MKTIFLPGTYEVPLSVQINFETVTTWGTFAPQMYRLTIISYHLINRKIIEPNAMAHSCESLAALHDRR